MKKNFAKVGYSVVYYITQGSVGLSLLVTQDVLFAQVFYVDYGGHETTKPF